MRGKTSQGTQQHGVKSRMTKIHGVKSRRVKSRMVKSRGVKSRGVKSRTPHRISDRQLDLMNVTLISSDDSIVALVPLVNIRVDGPAYRNAF